MIHSFCEIKGGIIDGNNIGTGIRLMFHNKHNIGNQSAGGVGQGPIIKNCTQGLFAQEGATGHSDFVNYEDNTIAIRCNVNSRVNTNGSDFKRNDLVARVTSGSNIGWSDNEILNIGTSNDNTSIFDVNDGGITYVGSNAETEFSYPSYEKTLGSYFDLGSYTGNTSENYFKSYNFPRGFLNNYKFTQPKKNKSENNRKRSWTRLGWNPRHHWKRRSYSSTFHINPTNRTIYPAYQGGFIYEPKSRLHK